jgi:hypothetical protein
MKAVRGGRKINLPHGLVRNGFWHLALPAGFMLFVFTSYPFREVFGNPDEGINVMKAMLMSSGEPLYGAIWSDQPPVFSYMLLFVFRLFGFKVNIGRVFVLVLSGILMWAYAWFMRIAWGDLHALIGAVVLLFLPFYLPMSVAIMVGLPALSLAMVSLVPVAVYHRDGRSIWLVLSAAIMSAAVLTKLFVGIIAPVVALVIWAGAYARGRNGLNRFWTGFRPAFLYGAVFALVTLVLTFWLIGFEHFDQVITPHVEASALPIYENDESLTLEFHLGTSVLTIVLAYAGALITVIKRNILGAYPILWAVAAYLFLSNHSPVWGHQVLLVTIPAAMLAGYASAEGMIWLRGRPGFGELVNLSGLIHASVVLVFLFLAVTKGSTLLSDLRPAPSFSTPGLKPASNQVQFLVIMLEYADDTHVMLTDLPLYAFRAGIPVLPDLVVFSHKRVVTGNISEDQLIRYVAEEQPEQIFLGRFDFEKLETVLAEDYELVRRHDTMRLYILKSLLSQGRETRPDSSLRVADAISSTAVSKAASLSLDGLR